MNKASDELKYAITLSGTGFSTERGKLEGIMKVVSGFFKLFTVLIFLVVFLLGNFAAFNF